MRGYTFYIVWGKNTGERFQFGIRKDNYIFRFVIGNLGICIIDKDIEAVIELCTKMNTTTDKKGSTTTCFACGSTSIQTGLYEDTINGITVALRRDTCSTCKTEGDFDDKNDSIIEEAMLTS